MVRGVYPERKSEMLRCASYSSLRSDDKVPCHPEHTHFAQCKLREGSQSIRWFAEFILSGKARCFDALVILRSDRMIKYLVTLSTLTSLSVNSAKGLNPSDGSRSLS